VNLTVHARAPVRTNDLGGWTDTWFAGRGKVLNLAVLPGVEVEVRVGANPRRVRRRVAVRAENFGQTFLMDPDAPRREPHGLLQYALAALSVPADFKLEVSLFSSVPAGISTGTSAAVSVALIAALNELRPRKLGWEAIARLAHRVETEKLGRQSGIQDQIAAAHGGVSFIDMSRYPEARVQAVRLRPAVRNELERRLCLVTLGRSHTSTVLHSRVIAALEAGGPQLRFLRAMAAIAVQGRAHLRHGDLEAYGEDMTRNHECQRALHPSLISAEADAVAAVARRYRAAGWKVNGAGGRGGSMTVLASADDVLRRRMVRAVAKLGRGLGTIPVRLSPSGVEAWRTGAKEF
jgi:D-glycero-alpha-D-manno-heptose-7-phosphate kinase